HTLAEIAERLHDVVPRAGQIADVEPLRHCYLHAHGAIDRRTVIRIRAEACITRQLKALAVLLALVRRLGGDLVLLRLKSCREDFESDGAVFTVASRGESGGVRRRAPMFGKTQSHRSFGASLDVAVYRAGEGKRFATKRDRARGWRDANGD